MQQPETPSQVSVFPWPLHREQDAKEPATPVSRAYHPTGTAHGYTNQLRDRQALQERHGAANARAMQTRCQ